MSKKNKKKYTVNVYELSHNSFTISIYNDYCSVKKENFPQFEWLKYFVKDYLSWSTEVTMEQINNIRKDIKKLNKLIAFE